MKMVADNKEKKKEIMMILFLVKRFEREGGICISHKKVFFGVNYVFCKERKVFSRDKKKKKHFPDIKV